MKELISLLGARERRLLRLLLYSLLAAVILILAGGVWQRSRFRRAQTVLTVERRTFAQEDAKRQDLKAWQALWAQARRDLDEMKGKSLYDEGDIVPVLRVDLDRLLREAGLVVSKFDYDYAGDIRSAVGRVAVAFEVKSVYPAVKRFLGLLETFPKLLVVEGLSFPRTTKGQSGLSLRVTLAAYYAKKT
ncbi:MAG: hypothetical protein OEW05_05335 [Candidatus Aminicenantes bacterium]|nr:hypothetical protein [Candidatus Aminicenantes bacterium]